MFTLAIVLVSGEQHYMCVCVCVCVCVYTYVDSHVYTWNNRLVPNWEGVCQGCLFNSYAEYIMQNIRLDEEQAGIKIAGGNI